MVQPLFLRYIILFILQHESFVGIIYSKRERDMETHRSDMSVLAGNVFFVVILVAFMTAGCSLSPDIVIENTYFRYTISPEGYNTSFIDKSTGTERLSAVGKSICASVTLNGKAYPVTGVAQHPHGIDLQFAEPEVMAHINITDRNDHVIFEVSAVEGDGIESLTFMNIPLNLTGKPEDGFGVCAYSLNRWTQVPQLPVLQTHPQAICHEKFGIAGAKAALVARSTDTILETLRTIVKEEDDIPVTTVAGPWAHEIPFNHGSYLFNFGTLTLDTIDEWIESVQDLGFTQIDNHGGGERFFRFGDFHLNEEKWPNGWDDYREIVDRLHEAGIGSIFHTYAFFIDKHAEYVTPVPSQYLDSFRSFTLTKPIDGDDTEIVVDESTADMSTITGFFVHNSVTLHIGDELITFSGVTKEAPYRFTDCVRGAYGTTASSHSAGDKARHLKECFGLFVPDCESPLFEEIARRHAWIVDYCGFDGIYLDAIDGSSILRGGDDAWYWAEKFVMDIAKHFDRPVGMEMSAMWHHFWQYRSRWQAWDYPNRGHKRFIEIHADTVDGGLMLPLHLGWWNFQHFNPPQIEPCHTDIIDYLGCRLIGYDAGLSLTGGVSRDRLESVPLFKRLVERLKTYETLRHDGYFDEETRARLRIPGDEYRLVKDEADKWRLQPIQYEPHLVQSPDAWSSEWRTHNRFGKQPVKLRIEAMMSAEPYDHADAFTLSDFSRDTANDSTDSAAGVESSLSFADENSEKGGRGTLFTAMSSGATPQTGAWTQHIRTFDPVIDLSGKEAIGVWIKGDGHGEILNFRVGSPRHISYGAIADHYVTVDFTGWRYFELIETESSRHSDYQWPEGGSLYHVYRETINFGKVSELSLWYNNLPPVNEVQCTVSEIRALPMVEHTFSNPAVTVGGETIMFPVEMTSGMYLEYFGPGDCILYGPNGEKLADVTPEGDDVDLSEGDNDVSFSCESNGTRTPRARVTVIGTDTPI